MKNRYLQVISGEILNEANSLQNLNDSLKEFYSELANVDGIDKEKVESELHKIIKPIEFIVSELEHLVKELLKEDVQ